jgi:hypothetical protein
LSGLRKRGIKMISKIVPSMLVLLTIAITAVAAETSSKELRFLSDFETICVRNANSPDSIPQLLAAKRAVELGQFLLEISAPPPISGTFKALLMPLQGKSFKLKDDDMMLTISITDTGACILSSPEVNGDAVEKLFKDNMFINQIGKEIRGGSIHVTYAVSYPTPADTLHSLVFVDRELQVKSSGVRLSSLGELYLRARVPKVPEWPDLPPGSDAKAP